MIVGIIGAGNMASALAEGWAMADAGPDSLVLSDVDAERARSVAERMGGTRASSNRELAESVDVVVLAVKPDVLDAVASDIRVVVAERKVPVASILAATSIVTLEQALGPGTPILRLMPNVAAAVRTGTFCHVSSASLDERTERSLLDLFGLLGEMVAVDEPLMDAATAISGCGPAFFALVIEALIDAGVREGLSPDQAAQLAISTMAGTAALLGRRGGDPVGLRRRVTSPGGTTAAGVAVLEEHGVRAAFDAAVEAVVRRAQEMRSGGSGKG
jgi:pyrroline-5-carboxylate reductase